MITSCLWGSDMYLVVFACALLVLTTTLLHYEVLRGLNTWLPVLRMPQRLKLVVVVLSAFVARLRHGDVWCGALRSWYLVGGRQLDLECQVLPVNLHLFFSRNLYITGLWRPHARRSGSTAGGCRGAQWFVVDWMVCIVYLYFDGAILGAGGLQRRRSPQAVKAAPLAAARRR